MLTSDDAVVEVIPLFHSDDNIDSDIDKEIPSIDPGMREDVVPLSVILAMTCGMGGLQVVWSTIFSNGTIYLQALGLTHAWTSAIWSMPAICGFLVQPIVGAYSDSFQHTYGRRRPFMVAGGCGIVISITILAWASSLASWTTSFIMLRDTEATNWIARIYAIIAILTLSLSIQPLQCGLRALALDLCPAQQQFQAQSWAVRFSGVGQVLGCVAGLLCRPDGRDLLGDVTNFRVLTSASIFAIVVTIAFTCFGVKELPYTQPPSEKNVKQSFFDIIRILIRAARDTRGMLRRVFLIQGLSWMGWFGFLFYNTSHISNLYSLSSEASFAGQTSSHLGSLVTLMFSIVGSAATILLPLILGSELQLHHQLSRRRYDIPNQGIRCSRLLVLWSLGLSFSAVLMLIASFASSWEVAMAATAANGVSWAITNWAPFTLIGHIAREPDTNGSPTTKSVGTQPKRSESGVISGLHNIAISAPQVIAAAICGMVLEASQALGSIYGSGWVLATAALGYLAAGCLAFWSSRSEIFAFDSSPHDLER